MSVYRNPYHLSLQACRLLFNSVLERFSGIPEQAESAIAQQLEIGLGLATAASFKIVHPLLLTGWKAPRMKYRDAPLELIGFDVETVATTGQPKLFGFWYPAPANQYVSMLNPTLRDLFRCVREVVDNSKVSGFVTWGRLDIQCVIRLFEPTEKERIRISRGLSANIKGGKIIGTPPVMRQVGNAQFYISHYITGRSLKLGWIQDGRERTFWIFNLSQFYQNTIAITARGLGLAWKEFDKSTHIIDWPRYGQSSSYRQQCLASNRQDAVTVWEMARQLQERFHDVFDCYPSLLVSTGSLTDAAVSKMLSDNPEDYYSNSLKWLERNVWHRIPASVTSRLESLLAEAFSAGYVDQQVCGYLPEVQTADIAAAYPHKIRQLPDLRHSVLLDGSYNLPGDLAQARTMGYDIFTAIIRGRVTIPTTLKFHPITVKTYERENYRPTGEFYASYTLAERDFCQSHGAQFADEEYIIVGLRQREPAPIATVSERLGQMRTDYLQARSGHPKESDQWKLLDALQYLVKVIDNSIYGKTVMTTEVVQDVDGQPVITGYLAGDRFNPLYGAYITSETRIQVARAAMAIDLAGGRTVMEMTDSLYWYGQASNLPAELVRKSKTPGYFEPPQTVTEFFILKTGQYEFRTPDGHFHHKLRGLNVDRDEVDSGQSIYRKLILDHVHTLSPHTHPKDITITIPTRRLISIGSHESVSLQHLGLVEQGETELRPFVLSGKQSSRYVLHWRDALNGPIWLDIPHLTLKGNPGTSQYPLGFLSNIYEAHATSHQLDEMEAISKLRSTRNRRMDDSKRLFIWMASVHTGIPIPEQGAVFRQSWEELETHFGITRTELPKFLNLVTELREESHHDPTEKIPT